MNGKMHKVSNSKIKSSRNFYVHLKKDYARLRETELLGHTYQY